MIATPSAFEGDILVQLRPRMLAIANSRSMRRVAASLNDNPDGIYQELAMQVVSSCRVWAERKGAAVEPDIGFIVNGINYRVKKFYRSAVRHGMTTLPLHEEHPDLSMVVVPTDDNQHPNAGIVANDHDRGVGEACERLRKHRPDGYALLEAQARGTLPVPLPPPTRSKLCRERSQARAFLRALGVEKTSDLESIAPRRYPTPPTVTF